MERNSHNRQCILDEETFKKLNSIIENSEYCKNRSNHSKDERKSPKLKASKEIHAEALIIYDESMQELKELLKQKYKTIDDYNELYDEIELTLRKVMKSKRIMTEGKRAIMGYDFKNGKYVVISDEAQIVKNLFSFAMAENKLKL